MMSVNLSDIALLNIKGSDYHCIISLICKNEAIVLMQNADLTVKNWNIINCRKIYKNFEIIYKDEKKNRYKLW